LYSLGISSANTALGIAINTMTRLSAMHKNRLGVFFITILLNNFKNKHVTYSAIVSK